MCGDDDPSHFLYNRYLNTLFGRAATFVSLHVVYTHAPILQVRRALNRHLRSHIHMTDPFAKQLLRALGHLTMVALVGVIVIALQCAILSDPDVVAWRSPLTVWVFEVLLFLDMVPMVGMGVVLCNDQVTVRSRTAMWMAKPVAFLSALTIIEYAVSTLITLVAYMQTDSLSVGHLIFWTWWMVATCAHLVILYMSPIFSVAYFGREPKETDDAV